MYLLEVSVSLKSMQSSWCDKQEMSAFRKHPRLSTSHSSPRKPRTPQLTRLVSRHTASSTKTSHAQPNTKSKEHKTIPVTSPSLQLYTFLTWKSCTTSPVCTTLSATSNILWEQHTTKWQPHNSNELQKQQTFYARNYPSISLVQELRLFAEVVWEDLQRL